MENHRKSSHYTYDIKYHLVWIKFWGRHIWARGYFMASSGNVTDDAIKEYIKNQDLQEKSNSENFEIG